MKRIFAFFLSFLLILGICPMSALADTGGSGNVDGGGGSMGQGTSQNSWNPGMDGVRITVVDAESGQPVSTPFDLTNKNPTIKIHFGKISKIQYSRGTGISPTTGNYDYYTPAQAMPRIISSGSTKANIEAIKKYFCSEYAVELVAQQTGINYDELIGGEYKLLLEPMAYFKHNGVMYAMTAHEAALYNQQLGIYEKDYIEGSGQSYEGVVFTDGGREVIYYNQLDERWADTMYGTSGTIGEAGCGPTAMAIVTSTLTGTPHDPVELSEWSVANGHRCEGNGSYHSLIPAAAEAYGLSWESVPRDDPQAMVDALADGTLVVAIMAKGHFTNSGHFIVLRGVTAEGKILVADPASRKRSEQEWDLSIILDEARKGAAAGGPFWAIY